ncbi:hypothetical protein B0H12DRAFT_1242857 [Mycena haematopus]|nr:hypothetical protein B0H12DRAFT_1242857 [Mycena haematopus]
MHDELKAETLLAGRTRSEVKFLMFSHARPASLSPRLSSFTRYVRDTDHSRGVRVRVLPSFYPTVIFNHLFEFIKNSFYLEPSTSSISRYPVSERSARHIARLFEMLGTRVLSGASNKPYIQFVLLSDSAWRVREARTAVFGNQVINHLNKLSRYSSQTVITTKTFNLAPHARLDLHLDDRLTRYTRFLPRLGVERARTAAAVVVSHRPPMNLQIKSL